MSRWRALAAVHDVPETELRDRLVDALETLHTVADLLEVSPRRAAIVEALEELKGAADHSDEVVNLESEISDLEERLSRRLALEEERDALRAERDALRAERDDLQTRLAAAQPLIDAYAQAVTFARRFVSVGERAGVPLRVVKAVPGRGKPANANAVRRSAKKRI